MKNDFEGIQSSTSYIKMLKLFFVITTLITLVRSEIEGEWICEEIDLKGNCSDSPEIKNFIDITINKINNYEYQDNYYCPFNIVERYSKCIHLYFQSCNIHMPIKDKYLFLVNMPPVDNSRMLCTKGRPYKKEFREHMACLKALKENDVQTEVLREKLLYYMKQNFENQSIVINEDLQDKLTINGVDMELLYNMNPMKCQIYSEFIRLRYMQVYTQCGSKTEKFSRQLFSNIWPVSRMINNCDKQIYFKI
ncbi:uncharacterized protein LOC112597583 [Melanaphis sacchari]|uniref:uncharacterized protein LOC112597583 n=1 Tax=Melanaphis sacchari TaxID=742174 RepID=UPI000DC13323|nr:uncharacterized protein LOC112597583 [Melanaphis sacchari]